MEFVVNMMDEPRVLPGNTDDVDIRMNSSVCQRASESFRKHRHLHGYINNRQDPPTDHTCHNMIVNNFKVSGPDL